MKTRTEKIVDIGVIVSLVLLAAIAIRQCSFPRSVDAPRFPEQERGYTFYPDKWYAPQQGLPGDDFIPGKSID